jgi:hypothetical protein
MKTTPPFFGTQSNGGQSAGCAAPTAQFSSDIPPPGGWKLKSTKRRTVQQTEEVCCTAFFAIIQLLTTFGGLRKDVGHIERMGRRHFSLNPMGLGR